MPLRTLALCLLLTILGGCSLQPRTELPPPSTISWEEHQSRLQQLNTWELNGKIGIRTREDAHSANLYWHQQEYRYEIEMSGPLGQGGAHLEGQPGQVKLDISGEPSYHATSPEQLLLDRLGWSLPVTQAYWWVRGLPAPDSPHEFLLSDNRLAQLTQDGWVIHYLSYSLAPQPLPQKIRMSRDGLQITLIIREWITDPVTALYRCSAAPAWDPSRC